MEGRRGYKIAILILSIIVAIQGIFILIMMGRPRKPLGVPPAVKGRIAIVIDDWGYNLNNLHILDQIKYPLTASILPNVVYSRQLSDELHNRGLEVILHLPMEPHEKYRLEKNTISTFMDEATIVDIIGQDLSSVHYAKGASNHMGSKATEDFKTMSIIFNELKKRNLFFLDSFVSPRSICFSLARKTHLGFARRDVFLDNQEEAGYIRQQIYKLKNRAGVYGQAVGIGHDRQITLEVLKKVMPELEREGYKLVFVSELVK